MLTEEQWLTRATTFSLGVCPIYGRPVFIEERLQPTGRRLWVLKMESSNGWVLGKDGEFHFEPLPSSRTQDFIDLTRWESPDEVHTFWKENIKDKKPLYIN
jgi:hypothetical protein